MTKIILPAVLKPISRRVDKSVKLTLDTREVSPEEALALMALEGSEMWLCMSVEQKEADVPDNMGAVELGSKTPAQRLRSVMFILYKQETEKGKYVGTFDNFYNEHMEKLIQLLKDKIDD
jgi:hypothetical protein